MITNIRIENYKSVQELSLELGRINVLIGENGCGKSNILEAIAFAAAAEGNKLDHEFLASRGVRMTAPQFMRSAFGEEDSEEDIRISVRPDGDPAIEYRLHAEQTPSYVRWVEMSRQWVSAEYMQELVRRLLEYDKAKKIDKFGVPASRVMRRLVEETLAAHTKMAALREFLIYSPENTALRTFQTETQILPFGIRGEGLFAHLKALNSEKNRPVLEEVVNRLALLDWFERFDIPADLAPGESRIRIRDRYLREGALFDQRSANEGFLFLLFYFTLFISPDTPRFFAVDNVDASLNPKLSSTLVKELAALARLHDKQAILTTHNPAVLDGLDLHDDEQRLFVVYRTSRGHTRMRRVAPPSQVGDTPTVKLSEAFMRGYIGGLPKNF